MAAVAAAAAAMVTMAVKAHLVAPSGATGGVCSGRAMVLFCTNTIMNEAPIAVGAHRDIASLEPRPMQDKSVQKWGKMQMQLQCWDPTNRICQWNYMYVLATEQRPAVI